MRTLLSRATQVDPSFNVGLGLVLILAVAEIFAVTSYYMGRIRPARTTVQAVATTVARLPAPAASAPATAPPAANAAPSPEAVPQTPPPSLVDQLLREGVELRDRGDTTNALARFEEALDSEPSNVAALEEIAKTYDSMQLYDKSNDVWRKLHDMGPSAGEAYELADQRLKLGVTTPRQQMPAWRTRHSMPHHTRMLAAMQKALSWASQKSKLLRQPIQTPRPTLQYGSE